MKTELFERIETPQFSAEMNVVSGVKQFMKAVESRSEVQELTEMARQDSSHSVGILTRIYQLTDRKSHEDFEHPSDVAVAAYLLILSRVNRGYGWLAAKRVKSSSNFWWASIIAQPIRPGSIPSKATHTTTTPISSGKNPFRMKACRTVDRALVFIAYGLGQPKSPQGDSPTKQIGGITLVDEMCFDPLDCFSPQRLKAFRNSGTSNRVAQYLCEVGE